jgi:SAM-dependent methyltransferase
VSRRPKLPLPPLDMRKLVGRTDPTTYDNPTGALPYPDIDESLYWAVFDFGCGCGRLARQLLMMRDSPHEYLGIDLHRGMIEWCRKNLASIAPNYRFEHHDVRSPLFNPSGELEAAVFPAPEDYYSLVVAHSVFTHLVEWQAEHYLAECARILAPHGRVVSTWFLFDKTDFPMMGESDNALYVRADDPTAAVIYDRAWLERRLQAVGLVAVQLDAPAIHGHQWRIVLARVASGRRGVPLSLLYTSDAADE